MNRTVLLAAALCLRDYRFTKYVPLPDPEGGDACRIRRTLCLERMPDE
jgi:hypothetical protein